MNSATLRSVRETILAVCCLRYTAPRIALSSVACQPINFSKLSHKRHVLQKKVFSQKKCFDFLYNFVSNIFLILSRIQRDIVINVGTSSCEVHVILVMF